MKERIERLRKVLGKEKEKIDFEGKEHFILWGIGGSICQLFGFMFLYNLFLKELKINKFILLNSVWACENLAQTNAVLVRLSGGGMLQIVVGTEILDMPANSKLSQRLMFW